MKKQHFIKNQPLKTCQKPGSIDDMNVLGNPDLLQEDKAMYANTTITQPQELMGQAIEHLQGRQRDVYLLTMRLGLSLRESALKLGIAKATAQTYKTRAINFIQSYCLTAHDGQEQA